MIRAEQRTIVWDLEPSKRVTRRVHYNHALAAAHECLDGLLAAFSPRGPVVIEDQQVKSSQRRGGATGRPLVNPDLARLGGTPRSWPDTSS